MATRGGFNPVLVDPFTFKGSINCAGNPNYPAADAGDVWLISAAGKIGGALGTNVEFRDTMYCLVDGSPAGTEAAVGANWDILQGNIDGAVTGPPSAISTNFAGFNGTSGKVIQDTGVASTIDGTLAANSDALVPTEKAVKTYADTKAVGLTAVALKAVNYVAGSNEFVPTDTTAGNVQVTLPNAPADKTRVGIKMVIMGTGFSTTVVTAGTDVYNRAGGPTSASLLITGQAMTAQYQASTGIWYIQSNDTPLAGLDLRYAALNTPRVTTIVSSATPTINTDNTDAVSITALATAITSMTTNLTGTPANFAKLLFRIKDDGTARAITWGAKFAARTTALPTTTTAGKVQVVGFFYDTVTATWGCVANGVEP